MSILKKLFKYLIFLLIAFSLICFAGWAYLNSDYAKPQIAHLIGKGLSEVTGSNVSIDSISFSLPGTFTINELALSEDDTSWIEVKKLRISLSPAEILNGQLLVKSIEVDDLNLLSLPKTLDLPTSTPSSPSLSSFSPQSLAIEQVIVNHATFSSNVISDLNISSKPLSDGVQFYATLYPDLSNEVIDATFLLGPTKEVKENLSSIQLFLKLKGDDFVSSFFVDENKSGLVSDFIGYCLPGALLVEGNLKGSLDGLQRLYKNKDNDLSDDRNVLNGSITASIGGEIQAKADIYLSANNSFYSTINEAKYGPSLISGQILYSSEKAFNGTELNFSTKDAALLKNWGNEYVSGPLEISLRPNGTIDTLSAEIDFKADSANYKDVNAKKIAGNLTVYRNKTLFDGEIYLSAFIEDLPVEISTQFDWEPNLALSLNNLSIDSLNSKFAGSISYEQPTDEYKAEFKGSCNKLSTFSRWLPKDLEGETHFEGQWIGSQHSSLKLEVAVNHLKYNDIELKNGEIILSFNGLSSEKLRGNFHASVEQFHKNKIIFHNFILASQIDASEEAWPFTISIGQNSSDLAVLDADGSWFFNKNLYRLNLDHLHGNLFKSPIELQQPTTLELHDSNLNITPLAINVDSGSLHAYANSDSQEITAAIEFQNILLHLIDLNFSSLPKQGEISGKATLTQTLTNPKVTSEIIFNHVKMNEYDFANVPPFSGKVQIDVDENGLRGTGIIATKEHPQFKTEFNLPITFSLNPLNLNIDRSAIISGQVAISGEIQPILQLLSAEAINLAGFAEANISLSGTIDSPVITGSGAIKEGSFEILEIGTSLKNLTADFESTGKEIAIRNLSAFDKYNNGLTGSGTFLLDSVTHFPYQLDLDVKNIVLLEQDFIRGAFTGHLLFKGTVEGAVLSGKAIADSLTVTLPQETPALMNSVEVIYINQTDEEKIAEVAKDTPWPLTLDLNISAPNNVAIRGQDLTSDWKGNLAVTGPATNPVLSGQFKVTKGNYFFNGKEFEINQGSIFLDGALDNKNMTSLYVIASKDLGKVKAEVIVKGPVKNPEISFRSNPPLPQREILSWILFNRGSSEISPFQGSQLSESITNLKSENKGPDVLTKIRNSLGIDRIDISRDENNGNAVSIEVGKYISQNVFVSVNKSNVNRLAVEAALTRNIKLQARVGDDSEGQVILKWKHDY